jgi:hypothetical protein
MDFLTWLLSTIVGLIIGAAILIPTLLLLFKLDERKSRRK